MWTLGVLIFSVWFVLLGGGASQCSPDRIAAVKERYDAWLMSLPGVVGVGIGECDVVPCIKVYIEQSTPEARRRIPPQLDGCRVNIEETASFKSQPS